MTDCRVLRIIRMCVKMKVIDSLLWWGMTFTNYDIRVCCDDEDYVNYGKAFEKERLSKEETSSEEGGKGG